MYVFLEAIHFKLPYKFLEFLSYNIIATSLIIEMVVYGL